MNDIEPGNFKYISLFVKVLQGSRRTSWEIKSFLQLRWEPQLELASVITDNNWEGFLCVRWYFKCFMLGFGILSTADILGWIIFLFWGLSYEL